MLVNSLLGEYDCKMDEKGRFLMPSGLRKQLPENEREHFVIGRGLDKCLVIYPEKVWDKEVERLLSRGISMLKRTGNSPGVF